jgi:hypothetical protein
VNPFEYLLALYAIVAGLGVSLLVRSVGQMIEARDRVQLYWVHSCWLIVIFVAHVVSWFALWQFAHHSPWTVLQVLLLLCVPILLYLISHLAVPELDDDRVHDMRYYYFRHARWEQGLLLGVLVISTVGQHFIEPGAGWSPQDVTRGAIALILAPGMLSRAPIVHSIQAALLLIVVVLGISYVSTPIG